MMRTVGSAECLLMAVAQIVRFLEMTAHWSGASAPTASTCTASSNGSTPSRSSSSAPCVAKSGSSKNELIWRMSLECLSKTETSQRIVVFRNTYASVFCCTFPATLFFSEAVIVCFLWRGV